MSERRGPAERHAAADVFPRAVYRTPHRSAFRQKLPHAAQARRAANPHVCTMKHHIAAFLLAALAGSSASAQIAVASPPVTVDNEVRCTNLDLEKRVPCPDSTLFFHEGAALVESAYNARDYAQLESLYAQWCTGQDRFPDGRWKLTQYGAALRGNFVAWNNWARDLKAIQAWQAARPGSAAAAFAEATYWYAYAWRARGGGYASTVTPEGWELFRERMDRALAAAESEAITSGSCAAPYALRLDLLTEAGAPESRLVALYEEALKQHAEYHPIHFAMARHYQPKWGGTAAAYERFANRVAERTRAFEGMGMYARLYWLVDYRDNMPFVNDPGRHPSWARLRTGYEDLMKRYPSSMHNLTKFADVACRSSDSALYRTLRTRIDGYQDTGEFVDPVDVCDRRHRWTPPKARQPG